MIQIIGLALGFYYLCGLEYSFQLYTRLGRLDDISGYREEFLSWLIIPMLWLPLIIRGALKSLRAWYLHRYSMQTKRILKNI